MRKLFLSNSCSMTLRSRSEKSPEKNFTLRSRRNVCVNIIRLHCGAASYKASSVIWDSFRRSWTRISKLLTASSAHADVDAWNIWHQFSCQTWISLIARWISYIECLWALVACLVTVNDPSLSSQKAAPDVVYLTFTTFLKHLAIDDDSNLPNLRSVPNSLHVSSCWFRIR